MKDKLNKVKLFLRKHKYVLWIYGTLQFYLIIYFSASQQRALYKLEYNCLEIIEIKQKSEWKGEPSILLRNGNEIIEHFQYWSYKKKFINFRVGDKICKNRNTLNFIHFGKDGASDTFIDGIKSKTGIFFSKIIGVYSEPIIGDYDNVTLPFLVQDSKLIFLI